MKSEPSELRDAPNPALRVRSLRSNVNALPTSDPVSWPASEAAPEAAGAEKALTMSAFASSRRRRGPDAPGAADGPFAKDAGAVLKFPVSISREAMRFPSQASVPLLTDDSQIGANL